MGRSRRALLAATRPIRPWRAGGASGAELALPYRWRHADQPIWFHHTLEIDQAWRGRDVWLYLDVAEGLLHLDGVPFHGLDRQHHDVVLPGSLTNAPTLALSIEASRAAPFGGAWFRHARAGTFDAARHRLLHSLAALCALADHLAPGRDRNRVERLLAELDSLLDGGRRAPGDAVVSRALALLDGFAAAGARSVARRGGVHLVGHSHIDVVWLWTLAETRRKCARTFSTMLRLMERYPRFEFAQTQAQLYEFVKQDHPGLYAQVRERVREGRWEPVGCTWVEPDCNIPNGESLVRQVVYGRRFFVREFGGAGDTLWLPDTFGYAWSLPQILRLGGIRNFFTTKLLWNDTTVFPHHSFWWEGLDGSRVLAHNPPVGLEGLVTPQHLAKIWRTYAERERTSHVLMTYGYGDGGGGVTAEHLDALPLLAAAPGLPAAAPSSVSEFFDALARDGARLPVWRDELYLELHRGTYTTHAWLKRANRKAEAALYVTDLLSAMADVGPGPGDRGEVGPALESLWKRLLLNQFHDIVPGTAIEAAYEDTRRDFAELHRGCESLQRRALARALPPAAPVPGEAAFTLFNPLPWDRVEYVELPAAGGRFRATASDGAPLPSQRVGNARTPRLLCEVNVPAMGCAQAVLAPGRSRRAERPVATRELTLDTPLLRVEFDRRGAVTTLMDKRHARDAVASGERLNVFQAFRDEPAHWEAWDIDPDYERKPLDLFTAAEAQVVERGPVRWRLRLVLRSRGRTRLEQDVVLHRGSPRIDFRTRVRWHERRTLLKVAFPLAVAASHARRTRFPSGRSRGPRGREQPAIARAGKWPVSSGPTCRRAAMASAC